VQAPDLWVRRCGLPSGQDPGSPPQPVPVQASKSHFDRVRQRRSDAEGELLLAEALARPRVERGDP
jgi:hypothetical protein